MMDGTPSWFGESLAALTERRDLSREQIRAAMRDMIEGQCGEVEMAAWLIALRMKGETASELAAAAAVLREHMVPFETGRSDALDTCGTGGDETRTFNISTATAFVAAGAGVPVVKHGNRAVSSCSGSADVLQALGVTLQEGISWSRHCLERAGLAFCYAPHFHPALCHVVPLRGRLKTRTLFNCLGPLANPAGTPYQLLGVGRPELLEPMAGAVARLGIRRAFLVHSRDGLDEVSLSAPTMVREVRGHEVLAHEWTPHDFGLPCCSLDELKVASPEESAALIRGLLWGQDSAAARIVIANAAAALLAAERANTLLEGAQRATDALRSGKARQVLELLIACSEGAP
jgi:anthranilate phosphoribosyltransferase